MKDVTVQENNESRPSPEETHRVLPDETVKTLSAKLNKMSWSKVHLQKHLQASAHSDRHTQADHSPRTMLRPVQKPKSDKELEDTPFNDLSVTDMMRLFGMNARQNAPLKLNAEKPVESKNELTP